MFQPERPISAICTVK